MELNSLSHYTASQLIKEYGTDDYVTSIIDVGMKEKIYEYNSDLKIYEKSKKIFISIDAKEHECTEHHYNRVQKFFLRVWVWLSTNIRKDTRMDKVAETLVRISKESVLKTEQEKSAQTAANRDVNTEVRSKAVAVKPEIHPQIEIDQLLGKKKGYEENILIKETLRDEILKQIKTCILERNEKLRVNEAKELLIERLNVLNKLVRNYYQMRQTIVPKFINNTARTEAGQKVAEELNLLYSLVNGRLKTEAKDIFAEIDLMGKLLTGTLNESKLLELTDKKVINKLDQALNNLSRSLSIDFVKKQKDLMGEVEASRELEKTKTAELIQLDKDIILIKSDLEKVKQKLNSKDMKTGAIVQGVAKGPEEHHVEQIHKVAVKMEPKKIDEVIHILMRKSGPKIAELIGILLKKAEDSIVGYSFKNNQLTITFNKPVLFWVDSKNEKNQRDPEGGTIIRMGDNPKKQMNFELKKNGLKSLDDESFRAFVKTPAWAVNLFGWFVTIDPYVSPVLKELKYANNKIATSTETNVNMKNPNIKSRESALDFEALKSTWTECQLLDKEILGEVAYKRVIDSHLR